MKKLESLRESLKAQISELQHKLAGVEMAMRTIGGEPEKLVTAARPPRVNVKQLLLQLLDEVGDSGLNAAKAVEMAAKRNEQVERATASSLLSRFKSDGVVVYDGTNYRLKKFAKEEVSELSPMH